MLRKFSLATSIAMQFLCANAQDSTKSLSFSGSVDVFYRNDFANQISNNKTSFTNANNSFELGMASGKLDASVFNNKIHAVIDMGIGNRAKEFSYADGSSLALLKQAYVTVQATSNLKLTAGKFATHVGYELLDPQLNKQYSMSYMFTNGPFFHTGAKADYTYKQFGFMLGIADFTDNSTNVSYDATGTKYEVTATKNAIAQVSYASKNAKHKVFVNYSGFEGAAAGLNPLGAAALRQVDLVYTFAPTGKINFGYNFTQQSIVAIDKTVQKWHGNALYTNVIINPTVEINMRNELISDSKKFKFGTTSIFANTIGANIKIGEYLLIQPELRFENSKDKIFMASSGAASNNSAAALLGLIVKF